MNILNSDWDHEDWEDHMFLEPPFDDDEELMGRFAIKLMLEIGRGHVTETLLLTRNDTSSVWFSSLVPVAAAFCLVRGDWVAAPTHAQAFFYFRPNGAAFEDVFEAFGLIVVPRASHHASQTTSAAPTPPARSRPIRLSAKPRAFPRT
jgi:hypothetical protein